MQDRFLRLALRVAWLRPAYRMVSRYRRNTVLAGCVAFAVLLVCILLVLHRALAEHLLHVDAAAIYQLAISIGAALVGLIGVVFTLTLFVIQQISNTSIPGLLREYAGDRGTQLIYAALTLLALLALSSALIIPAKHPLAPILLTTLAVLGALSLLWVLFQRVVDLSDPSNVIRRLRKRALDELQSLERLRTALLEQIPELARERVRLDHDPNSIPTALGLLRHHNPSLTDGTELHLRQLYALVRRLASEHQTDLFREAIGATSDVLAQYVDYHGRNINMPSTTAFMFGMSIVQDRILSNALDVYTAVAKASAPVADVEMSKATLRGMAAIASKSVQRSPLNAAHGENATAGFVIGSMIEIVQFFIVKGHTEGVFTSFVFISPVLNELAERGFYQTALYGISKLSELSQLCVVAKQPILATEGVANLITILGFALDKSLQAGDTAGTCVKELFLVCAMQLELEPTKVRGMTFDIGRAHPVSRIFDIGDDTLVGLHHKTVLESINALRADNEERWRYLSGFLSTFHEALPRRMAELATNSSGKQHMLLYRLETAAFSMAQRMLQLWYQLGKSIDKERASDKTDSAENAMSRHRHDEYRNRVSEQLCSFVVFFYSRSPTFEENGYLSETVVGCYESVVSIASDAVFLGASDIATASAGMLKHSARAALDKHSYAAVSPTCRFVARLLETAALARTKQDTAVAATAEEVIKRTFLKCVELTVLEQERHAGLHLADPARLLTSQIREHVRGDRDSLVDQKSGTFTQAVSRQAALEYLTYIDAKFTEWAEEVRLPPPA